MIPLLLTLSLGCSKSPVFTTPAHQLMLTLDRDHSGALSDDELRCSHAQQVLHDLDSDGDGLLSEQELAADLESAGGSGGDSARRLDTISHPTRSYTPAAKSPQPKPADSSRSAQ